MPEELEYLEPVETTEEAATPEESAPSEQLAEPEQSVEQEDKPQSKSVQRRIDELVKQREEARRDKEYWQEVAIRQQTKPDPVQDVKLQSYPDLPEPKSDDFDTYDAFVDARADWRAELKVRQFMQKQQTQTREQAIDAWQQQAQGKFSDWKEVFHNNLPISQTMAEVLLDSAQGHDLAYYLGKNPDEASRIALLPPSRQAYELGKIEVKLSGPPQKTKTNAPAPTAPVGGKEIPSKKPEDMSYEEYKAWRSSGGGT